MANQLVADAIDALEEANTGRSYHDIQATPNQIIVRTEVVDFSNLAHDQLADKLVAKLPNKLLDESQTGLQTQAVIHTLPIQNS